MDKIEIIPFESSREAEILQFAQAYPWKPLWSQKHVQEFLRQLTSSQDLVFDLFSEGSRIATAVLIDKLQNKGNNACLEFVGLDPRYELSQMYKLILLKAKQNLAKARSGIEITILETLTPVRKFAMKEGFSPYYDTFEMTCETRSFSNLLSSGKIFDLVPSDFGECYKVLEDSFKDNLDISTPGFEEWKLARKDSKDSRAWVYKEVGKIVGYLNLAISREFGEIRSVGVAPFCRGKGIGRNLICYAMNYLAHNQIPRCRLTVATQNKNALRLYLDLGFDIINHYGVFLWSASTHE
jgi:ribosomal protein S18 acetylase RimI-like enzyme